jgi:hypothetical protein
LNRCGTEHIEETPQDLSHIVKFCRVAIARSRGSAPTVIAPPRADSLLRVHLSSFRKDLA